MEGRFELQYSPEFYKDLELIIDYILYELKNEIAAHNFIDSVQKNIFMRAENPLDYEEYKTPGGNIYYRIYVNNYIIFYTVSNRMVQIRGIIYRKRNLDKLL